MGCYKRKLSKGDRWYYKFDYQGKTYKSKAIYISKTEAKKAEAEFYRGIDELVRNPNSLTLLALFTERLDYLQAKKSNDYYKENQRHFKKALDVWGNLAIEKVTRKMVSDLLLKEAMRLKKQGKTNHKVNSMLRNLKAAFNHGIKTYDLTLRNPCVNVEFFSIDVNLKYIPSDEEIKIARDLLSPVQRLLFDFVEQTGCRIMEAIRFKYSDIDGNLITLYTRKSKNSNLTPRRIPCPDCIKGMTGQGKVFTEWNAYPRFLEDALVEHGNKWNWHSLRHRRASLWANNGMTTFEIMSRLGHSNMSTTMRYLQLLGFSRQ